MTLADDLRAARALIDKPEKWTKGEYEDNGCYCIAGALASAKGIDGFAAEASNAARALAAELATGEGGVSLYLGIVDFNDDSATTHADVMALFDRAISKATATHEDV